MTRKYLDHEFELKHLDDGGSFSGYASVFGVQDSDGDVIVKGAFAESIEKFKERGKMPKMLWQHDPRAIVGQFHDMFEDDHGLFVKGSLIMEVEKGREAYALMKAKQLDAMSVGFNIDSAVAGDGTRNRVIERADLWEISLVTWGANPEALITDVKSLKTERDFEQFLRDAGFSRKEAKTITSVGFKPLVAGETPEDEQRDAVLVEKLNSITNKLRSNSNV